MPKAVWNWLGVNALELGNAAANTGSSGMGVDTPCAQPCGVPVRDGQLSPLNDCVPLARLAPGGRTPCAFGTTGSVTSSVTSPPAPARMPAIAAPGPPRSACDALPSRAFNCDCVAGTMRNPRVASSVPAGRPAFASWRRAAATVALVAPYRRASAATDG